MAGRCCVLPVSDHCLRCRRSYTPYVDLGSADEYTYFIDNSRTVTHQFVIFGVRELSTKEMNDECNDNASLVDPPRPDQRVAFTANYALRTYMSGCYYLDAQLNWQSDGLWVRCEYRQRS